MTIAERMPESGALQNPEILDTNNFAGLYGRFLLAGLNPDRTNDIINPDKDASVNTSLIEVTSERNYNPITQKLSHDERLEGWKDVKFDKAYEIWRKKLTSFINGATDKRIGAILVITGKAASDFTVDDADTIYNKYCKGDSDTTAFVKTVVDNLKKDGKVDIEQAQALSLDIEWFSRNLFGKHTAAAVSKIIELETETTNNPDGVVNKIFADKNRINNLKDEEKQMLTRLYDGLEVVNKTTEPAKTESQPLAVQPEQSESTPAETVGPSVGQKYRTKKGEIEILEVIKRQSGENIFRVRTHNGIQENWTTERLWQNLGGIPVAAEAAPEPVTAIPVEPAKIDILVYQQTEADSQQDHNGYNPDLVGNTIQYHGKKHTITEVKDDKVHTVSESGSRRSMETRELEEKLRKPGTQWKLVDRDGNPVTFDPNLINEDDFIPAPLRTVDN